MQGTSNATRLTPYAEPGLVSSSNADAGLFVAPGFVAGQIIFLIAFVLYLAAAIFALVLDFDASAVSAVAKYCH